MKRNIDQVDRMRSRSPLTAVLILCLGLSGIGGHVHAMVEMTDSAGLAVHSIEMVGMAHHGGHEGPGAIMTSSDADEACCQDQASCHCSAIPQFLGASTKMQPHHRVMPLRSPKVFDFIVDIVPPPPKLA